jgi:hypothetical protein
VHWSTPAVRTVLTIAHLDRTGPPGPNDGPLDSRGGESLAGGRRAGGLVRSRLHGSRGRAE